MPPWQRFKGSEDLFVTSEGEDVHIARGIATSSWLMCATQAQAGDEPKCSKKGVLPEAEDGARTRKVPMQEQAETVQSDSMDTFDSLVMAPEATATTSFMSDPATTISQVPSNASMATMADQHPLRSPHEVLPAEVLGRVLAYASLPDGFVAHQVHPAWKHALEAPAATARWLMHAQSGGKLGAALCKASASSRADRAQIIASLTDSDATLGCEEAAAALQVLARRGHDAECGMVVDYAARQGIMHTTAASTQLLQAALVSAMQAGHVSTVLLLLRRWLGAGASCDEVVCQVVEAAARSSQPRVMLAVLHDVKADLQAPGCASAIQKLGCVSGSVQAAATAAAKRGDTETWLALTGTCLTSPEARLVAACEGALAATKKRRSDTVEAICKTLPQRMDAKEAAACIHYLHHAIMQRDIAVTQLARHLVPRMQPGLERHTLLESALIAAAGDVSPSAEEVLPQLLDLVAQPASDAGGMGVSGKDLLQAALTASAIAGNTTAVQLLLRQAPLLRSLPLQDQLRLSREAAKQAVASSKCGDNACEVITAALLDWWMEGALRKEREARANRAQLEESDGDKVGWEVFTLYNQYEHAFDHVRQQVEELVGQLLSIPAGRLKKATRHYLKSVLEKSSHSEVSQMWALRMGLKPKKGT